MRNGVAAQSICQIMCGRTGYENGLYSPQIPGREEEKRVAHEQNCLTVAEDSICPQQLEDNNPL